MLDEERRAKERQLRELRARSAITRRDTQKKMIAKFELNKEQNDKDKRCEAKMRVVRSTLTMIEKIGYRPHKTTPMTTVDHQEVPVVLDERTWNSVCHEYHDIQQSIVDNVYGINHRLKLICDRAIRKEDISEETYDTLLRTISLRQNMINTLSSNARNFAFLVKNYTPLPDYGIKVINGKERKYKTTKDEISDHLEMWERTECYKVKCGISESALDDEMRILKHAGAYVMSEEDTALLSQFLLQEDSPMRIEMFNMYTAKFATHEDRLRSIGFGVSSEFKLRKNN